MKKLKIVENEKSNFFNDICKVKKVPQIFIDEYTKREDFNEKNKEINKALSNKNFGIKDMNKSIEDYFTRSDLFLTSYINPVRKPYNQIKDIKEQIAFNLYDPKYSIAYLDPKPINIFAKTQMKIERNNLNMNRQSIDENYQSFMKRKDDFIESQQIKKMMRNSKSVQNIPESILIQNTPKNSNKTIFNENLNNINSIFQKDKDKICEALSNIVNSKKEFKFKPNDDDEISKIID